MGRMEGCFSTSGMPAASLTPNVFFQPWVQQKKRLFSHDLTYNTTTNAVTRTLQDLFAFFGFITVLFPSQILCILQIFKAMFDIVVSYDNSFG
jgi:hypothetical protein